jgi:hypothetical protein
VDVGHQPVEPFDEGFNIRLALPSPAKQIANCVLNFRVLLDCFERLISEQHSGILAQNRRSVTGLSES